MGWIVFGALFVIILITRQRYKMIDENGDKVEKELTTKFGIWIISVDKESAVVTIKKTAISAFILTFIYLIHFTLAALAETSVASIIGGYEFTHYETIIYGGKSCFAFWVGFRLRQSKADWILWILAAWLAVELYFNMISLNYSGAAIMGFFLIIVVNGLDGHEWLQKKVSNNRS